MAQFRSILQRVCPLHQDVSYGCEVHDGAAADCDDCRAGTVDPWRLIHDAAKEDAAMRYPGVTGGIYGLKDIGLCGKLLPRGVPMIRSERHVFGAVAETDEVFLGRLYDSCQELAGFDFKRHGLCMAGGAVTSMLTRGNDEYCHDFDLFLVGHKTEDSAREAIVSLRLHLEHIYGAKSTVYRTQGCITFLLRHRKPFQVILRMYSTLAEVIHGFDLGSSAVLWDGEKIWMTALGRLAIQYGVNVLNLQARRASLEVRIARYFERGFDIVLPGLDVAEFAKTGRLPYLSGGVQNYLAEDEDENSPFGDGVAVVHQQRCICSAEVYYLHATRPGCDDRGRRLQSPGARIVEQRNDTPAASDYALQMTYGNVDRITLRNAVILAHDEIRTAGLCAVGGHDCDMFDIQPTLDPEVVCRIISNCLEHRTKICVPPLVKLFGRAKAAEIVANYIMNNDVAPVHRLGRERVAELNRRAEIPFAFMRVEENTSLTGPFPRHVLTPAQWYGSAYYPANVWRKTLDAAIILARLGVTPYELLWILQWVAPSLKALDQARVIRLLERVRKSVAK